MRRKHVYRNLARTEKYFIPNIRESFDSDPNGFYDSSSVYENFKYIRPRFKRLYFNKHPIFKNNHKRRLIGYGLARLAKAPYYGDVTIGLTYLYSDGVYRMKRNIRKMNGENEFIKI
jgi:hypothetical protein